MILPLSPQAPPPLSYYSLPQLGHYPSIHFPSEPRLHLLTLASMRWSQWGELKSEGPGGALSQTHSLPLHFFLCLCSGFTPRTDLSLSMWIYWLLLNSAATALSVWLLSLQATRKRLNDNYCDIWYKGSSVWLAKPGMEHSCTFFAYLQRDWEWPYRETLLILTSGHSKVKEQEAQTCSMVAFKPTESFLFPLFSLLHMEGSRSLVLLLI